VADQLWFMTRIREEEEELSVVLLLFFSSSSSSSYPVLVFMVLRLSRTPGQVLPTPESGTTAAP